jgi:hypothetical protein
MPPGGEVSPSCPSYWVESTLLSVSSSLIHGRGCGAMGMMDRDRTRHSKGQAAPPWTAESGREADLASRVRTEIARMNIYLSNVDPKVGSGQVCNSAATDSMGLLDRHDLC